MALDWRRRSSGGQSSSKWPTAEVRFVSELGLRSFALGRCFESRAEPVGDAVDDSGVGYTLEQASVAQAQGVSAIGGRR